MSRRHVFVLLITALLAVCAAQNVRQVRSVGVVGGGIGGASLSYYLKKLVGQVNITAFEASDYLGGRLKHFEYDGAKIELGGDAFADENTYLLEITKDLNISLNAPNDGGNGQRDMSVGIWNGKSFVVLDPVWAKLRELALEAQILRFKASLKINYQLRQLLSKTFNTVEEFLAYGGLSAFTSQSSKKFAESWWVGDDLAKSAWEPLTRVIYDQSLSIQAFAGIVALLPAVSDNFSALKGNSYMVEKMYEFSRAKVNLNTRAQTVRLRSDGKYEIDYSSVDGQKRTEVFDDVVLAAPYEVLNLQYESFSPPQIVPRTYRSWDITIVIAKSLNPSYFNVTQDQVPSAVLTTADSTDDFIAITYQGSTDSNSSIFKVSANKNVSMDISSLFLGVQYVQQHTWPYTFPTLDPLKAGEKFQPVYFHKGTVGNVYYVNGIESAATAMECSVISARNIAQKIAAFK